MHLIAATIAGLVIGGIAPQYLHAEDTFERCIIREMHGQAQYMLHYVRQVCAELRPKQQDSQ